MRRENAEKRRRPIEKKKQFGSVKKEGVFFVPKKKSQRRGSGLTDKLADRWEEKRGPTAKRGKRPGGERTQPPLWLDLAGSPQ